MYPMLREDVSLRTSKNKNSDILRYFVKNGLEEEFEISSRLYYALLKADGTKPLMLPDKGRKIIPRLKKYMLVYTSRFSHFAGPFFRFTLFPVGNNIKKFKWLFKIMNSLLPIAAISLFIVGIFVKLLDNNFGVQNGYYPFIYWLYFLIMWISIMFHEIGHLNAGIAYGYKVSSVGLLLLGIFPVAAYVSYNPTINYNKCLTQKEKIQFSLGGIEMNLMISGILMLASVIFDDYLSETFIMSANINIVMAILNSLPAFGLDGERALSELLEIDSIFSTALEWMLNKSMRNQLLKKGFVGYFCLAFFCLLIIIQLFVILVIIADFVSIIYLIFNGSF